MRTKLIIFISLCLLGGIFFTWRQYRAVQSISSYEACATSMGSYILESYPATCVTRLGARFTQPIIPDESSSLPAPSVESYTCPANGWVDCMPILNDVGKKACTVEAMDWYRSNCPGFQGAAL